MGGKRIRGESKGADFLRAHASHQGDDCLIWPFSRVRGYGLFYVSAQRHYAHRYMCELVNGPPPTPQHQAAHSCGCGHAGCVNPRHLSWKTHGENQKDRRLHGTKAGGFGKYTPKLTVAEVKAIRILKGTKTQDEIAKMFSIGRRNVGAILANKTWSNVR